MKVMILAIMSLAMMMLAGACSSQPVEAIYDFDISLYQGSDALGSKTVAVSDLRGQPVVLNFWAGLCPPCRAEMPEFQRFADEYDGRATLVGVDLGQFFALGSEADALALLQELGVTYPAGATDDGNVVRELGVLGLPATFFIAADGSLHRKWQGVLNGEKLAEITDEMLGSDPNPEKSITSRGTLPSGNPNDSVWPDRPPTLGAANFSDADVWVALYDVDQGGDQVGMEVWVMTEIDIQPYSLAVWVDGMQFSNNVPLYKGQEAQKLGGVKTSEPFAGGKCVSRYGKMGYAKTVYQALGFRCR